MGFNAREKKLSLAIFFLLLKGEKRNASDIKAREKVMFF
jgi:hypothetical protein